MLQERWLGNLTKALPLPNTGKTYHISSLIVWFDYLIPLIIHGAFACPPTQCIAKSCVRWKPAWRWWSRLNEQKNSAFIQLIFYEDTIIVPNWAMPWLKKSIDPYSNPKIILQFYFHLWGIDKKCMGDELLFISIGWRISYSTWWSQISKSWGTPLQRWLDLSVPQIFFPSKNFMLSFNSWFNFLLSEDGMKMLMITLWA